MPNNFKCFFKYLYHMKMLITEKQLSSILRKKKITPKEVDEADNTTTSTPASSTSTPASASSSASSSASTASPTSSDDPGTSPGADDYPPYPEVGKWESGVTRGPANQIAVTKWSDTVGSKLTRGKANPLK